ncbi:zinc finger protein OZF-like [Phlebotomus argentipes]|uniref:zinc finger protein OZF-like n=1 Tax=Phlebotomus argentipes TaxID=94469 RepID=UPI00289358D5|nr:zinc finger protein OZF-like [Phlebotomus argentipes]
MASTASPLIPCPVIEKVFRRMSSIQELFSSHSDSTGSCGICSDYQDEISSVRTQLVAILSVFPRITAKAKEEAVSESGSDRVENSVSDGEYEMGIKREDLAILPKAVVLDFTHTEDRITSGELILECAQCGSAFTTKEALLQHCQSHIRTLKPLSRKTGERREYKCKVCGKILYQRKGLTEHSRIHTGEKPFKCTTCGKSFRFSSQICRHRLKHASGEPSINKCDFCGKSLSGKERLVEHMRMHTGDKPAQCDVCGKRFHGEMALYSHRRLQHLKQGVGPKVEYKCEICGKTRARKTGLMEHMRIHTGEKPFRCDVCGKSFTLKNHCVKHREIHERSAKGPQFTCEFCGRNMSGQERLTEHMRMHTGEKPAQCDVCGRTFHGRMALYSHRRTQHSTEGNPYRRKRYKCDICGKFIMDRNRLTEHVRIHTGEKPFACSFCERSFARKAKLLFHVKRQHKITGE